MKKSYVIIITIVVCLLLLGIGYYFGGIGKSDTSKESNFVLQESQSNFDKETGCVNMYPVVKEYLMDLYEYGEPDIAGEDYGRIISIEVWYSPSLNSCIAEIRRDVMTYGYELNGKHYYKLNVVSSLLDINHGYKNQYTCEINPDVEENCELEFYKMRGKLKE